jgi:hypothetical protein
MAQALQQAEQLETWEDEGGVAATALPGPPAAPEVHFTAVEQGARRDVRTALPAAPPQLKN